MVGDKVLLNNVASFKVGYRYFNLSNNSITNIFSVSTFPNSNNQIFQPPSTFVSSLSYYIVLRSEKRDPKFRASNITIRTPNRNYTFIPPDINRRYVLIQDQVKLINIFTYTYFKQEN